jgi:hypothetical protein
MARASRRDSPGLDSLGAAALGFELRILRLRSISHPSLPNGIGFRRHSGAADAWHLQ